MSSVRILGQCCRRIVVRRAKDIGQSNVNDSDTGTTWFNCTGTN
jgi:hypothetical protein